MGYYEVLDLFNRLFIDVRGVEIGHFVRVNRLFAADLEEGAADEGDNRSDHFGDSGPHDEMDLGLKEEGYKQPILV